MIQMNLFMKQTHRTLGYQEGWWGSVSEFGIDMCTLLYLEWITNMDLLYSAGNSAQYSAAT